MNECGKRSWSMLLVIVLIAGNALADYNIIELPKFPGGNYITPTGINSGGVAVGNGDGIDVVYENGAKWISPYTSVSVFGPLPDAPDNVHRVYAINDSGLAVGHSRAVDYSVQATIWDAAGITKLTQLQPGIPYETYYGSTQMAYGVNNAGKVVGRDAEKGVLWEKINGNWTKMQLPSITDYPNYPIYRAEDINESDMIVGWNGYVGELQGFPIVWEKVNGTWAATFLPISSHGSRQGSARAINDLNQVAGYIQDAKYGPYTAIRWEKDIDGIWQKIVLHDAALGYTHSFAQDINNSGVIVGGLRNNLPGGWKGGPDIDGQRAFIYDSVNGMRDLNNLIDPASGWVLTDAKAINDNGIIVGLGTYYDQPSAFILLPSGSPVLDVSPLSRTVNWTGGQTTFDVTNTGTGTLAWAAQVVSGSNWLTITSDASGTNAGTLTIQCSLNNTGSPRTGTIRVTADGAANSPKDITIVQSSVPSTVIQLSPLAPSGTTGVPADINSNGVVVGKGDNSEALYTRCAIRWTWDSPFAMAQDLAPLPNSGDRIHEAFNVNDSGVVVGISRASDWSVQATVWEDGTPIELPREGAENQAFGLNNFNQAVGFASTSGAQGYAVLWEKAGGSWQAIQLPTYDPAWWTRYQAHAINANGQIIVGWAGWFTGTQGDPVVWEKVNGTWQIAEMTNGGYGFHGAALAVNNAGIIAGYRNYGTASHAALWQKTSGIWQDTDIHNSALGYAHSLACDINSFGVVVGSLKANLSDNWGGDTVFVAPFEGERAFIYDPVGGMKDLNSFIPVGSGWVLKQAKAINDDGWIVGTGEYNGQPAAFLLGPVNTSGQTPDATVQLNLAGGTSIDRRILGHHYTHIRSWETPQPTLMRGINGGSNAMMYGWKDLSGIDNAWGSTTLSVLRQARDKDWPMLITANVSGTGTGTTYGTFQYTNTNVSHVISLAADWVRYTNHILQTYRQGSSVSGQDLTLLNSITWSDKLLSASEAQTDKVTYWEIGNEIDTWDKADYRNRYTSMTAAMRTQDSTIKVGPCVIAISPSQTNHGVRSVLQDSAARVDFFAYHPYDNLETAWGNVTQMESELRSIAGYQQTAWTNVRNTLTLDGRNPDQIELFATEWNPASAVGGVVEQSMYQAMGIGETVFTFADLNLSAANYWLYLGPYEDATQYPSYKLFSSLRRYFGQTLVNGYTDGDDLRVYVTKGGPNGEVVLWGLNFSNSTEKTIRIQLSNLGFTPEKATLMELGSVVGDRSLLQANAYSGNSERVDWQVANVTGLNPADFTLTFEKATITVLVLTPGAQVQIPGDANSDGMVDVGDLGILAANYGGTGKTWAQGDFNGDGLVDVGDLGILAAHYGEGSNQTMDFSADYAKAFGTTTTDDDTNNEMGLTCPIAGLPLMVGLILACLGLMGSSKLKE